MPVIKGSIGHRADTIAGFSPIAKTQADRNAVFRVEYGTSAEIKINKGSVSGAAVVPISL